MEGLVSDKKAGRFISVISDGRFHEKVTQETDGAVLRTYELRDGTKGEKWELVYQKVENVFITNVEFEDGEYGKNILVTLSDGENEVVWAQGVKTNFGEDLMKKLPAINFAEKVTIQPYSFPSEKTGKPVRGVNIYQNGDKVLSHFWDGEKAVNGIPEVDKEEAKNYDSDDWTAHFTKVRKFLVAYTEEHVRPKFAGKEENKGYDYPEEELDPSSVPF